MNDPNAATESRPPQDAETSSSKVASPKQPKSIGRYRVVKPLGAGGFGQVFLGHDDELSRAVAIKLPHRHRIGNPQDVDNYLNEARILASLDHPHIVPVYDVGRSEDGLPFVVSKYIQGSDLKERMKRARPTHSESTGIVATIAEALHYSHKNGLVHRDVKPGNILMDHSNKPFLADFGLALHESDFGKGANFAGTPHYMSPEQAIGEGHLVDGRSDVFSLGVVLYELLLGRRPFQGDSRTELISQIIHVEARPPRQIDDSIPKELERICLKALAKRSTERYTTAKDFAEDMRQLSTPGAWHSIQEKEMCALMEHREPRSPDGCCTLELATERHAGKSFLLEKDRVVLGRNDDCDIPLPSPAVARYHAQLVRTNDGYSVEDLQSRNGTYVNGKQVIGRVALRNSDKIHIAGIILIYHCER